MWWLIGSYDTRIINFRISISRHLLHSRHRWLVKILMHWCSTYRWNNQSSLIMMGNPTSKSNHCIDPKTNLIFNHINTNTMTILACDTQHMISSQISSHNVLPSIHIYRLIMSYWCSKLNLSTHKVLEYHLLIQKKMCS